MKFYLNKTNSYPITILGEITLNDEKYFITKATPVEEDLEVVVKLLRTRDVYDGLKTGKYSLVPKKEVKDRTPELLYENSKLCMEFYEAGYEDALQDVGLWEPEEEYEEHDEDEEDFGVKDDVSEYSLYPELFHKMTPEEKILTSIGIELPEKRLKELKNETKKG